MSDELSLGGILSGEAAPAPEPEQAPEPVAEPVQEPVPEPEATPEPAPEPVAAQQQPMTEKERAFYTAMSEERRKRQEIERQLKEIQAAQPPQEPKAFWDDPEGALSSFKQEVAKVVTTTRMDTAEQIARSKYNDFDDKINVFADVLQNTPGLREHWMNAADPAEFAYRTGKNYMELQQAGNIDSLRANIEKEVRLKLEAELKAKDEARKAEIAAIPPSLSNAQSAPGNKAVWGGPPSLDNILKP